MSGPPPSPATSVGGGRASSSRRGGSRGNPPSYRHYSRINAPPPPTPCSTDVAEESEGSIAPGYSSSRRPFVNRRQFPEDVSETYSAFSAGGNKHNSTFSRGGGSGAVPPPPSTPYLSDYCGEESEILSDFPVEEEESHMRIFVNNYAPPPSPVPSLNSGDEIHVNE